MDITHLLFDFGGVLVDLDRPRCERAFAALGIDVRPYLGDYGQQKVFSQLESGKITVPEFCVAIRQLFGKPQLSDADIVGAFEEFLVGIPAERLDCLLRLKRHYRLSLLSNTNPIHWRMAREGLFAYRGLGVDDFFEHIFLSFELGVEKPAPAIYQAVAAGGLDPQHTLFLDDSEANCEAARHEGFHAVTAPLGGGWMKFFDTEGHLCI